MKLNKFLIISLFVSVLPLAVSAHQPRLVMDTVSGSEMPIEIFNPDVSQAFYGELKGRADYYQIRLRERSDVYLSMVAPRYNGEIDFNLVLSNGDYGRLMYGQNTKWTEFYEEFGGDWYLQGPQESFNLPPGTYSIMVSSPDNYGKYSLVVGKDEAFPLSESINALWLLPQLKVRFFDAPVWEVFNGKIFQYFGVAVLLFVLILYLLISLWLHRHPKRQDKGLMRRLKRMPYPKMPKVPNIFSRPAAGFNVAAKMTKKRKKKKK